MMSSVLYVMSSAICDEQCYMTDEQCAIDEQCYM